MSSRLYRRLPPRIYSRPKLKIMTYQNQLYSGLKLISLVLILFLTVTIGSCSNEGEQANSSETSKQDTTEKKEESTPNNFLGTGKFAYLAIHKDSLEKFFITPPGQGGLNAKKIVFRFSHDGDAASNIVVDGFLTRSNNVNYLDRPPAMLSTAFSGASVNLGGQKIYLSDLEMTNRQYVNLRSQAGTNTYLLLVPYVIGSNNPEKQYCVTYGLFWISAISAMIALPKTFAPDMELNPSPPADPEP